MLKNLLEGNGGFRLIKSTANKLVHALLLATLALGAFSLPASALYNDQTRNFPARNCTNYSVCYQRVTINFNDPNIGTAQKFGALPANAYILAVDAYVSTAFNAGTTNVVTIGVTTSANEIVASGITAGTIGHYALTSAAGLGLAVTGNSTYIQGATSGTIPPFVYLYAKYAQTGTAATAGQVTVVIEYVQTDQ
jgi:hypothetical protein